MHRLTHLVGGSVKQVCMCHVAIDKMMSPVSFYGLEHPRHMSVRVVL